ncbi:hypothetical protein K474DRAFT_1709004 [Panus rudis PR-1116 ss-1]|nr:hypothetical protein K474DRAFT_1709004 [Panus rudis PR-1116 ss-1]
MSKFTPTPQEEAIVRQIFAQADPQKLGVITGDAAVRILNGSKLPPSVLGEIWSIADEDNNGVLTRKGVGIAVRLIGHAQRGERVSEALVTKPGPPPTIEGVVVPLAPQSTGVPLSKSPPPLPPLTPQDKAKFLKLFLGCGPQGGLITGDKARDVLVKSKLPVDKLSQIWNLADTKNRGALDATDFTIAMYLVQAAMSGQLLTIPPVLPPWLYEQAKNGTDTVVSHPTGESGSFSPTSMSFPRPISTIQPQFTGQSIQPQMTGQALKVTPTGPALPPRSVFPSSPYAVAAQTTGQSTPWDISPAEKANADRIFDGLDTSRRGYIEGDVAVPFMLQSGLPEDVLAQIWDLADVNNDGRLTRDGFAIALHLIQSKRTGKELPTSLPPSLVPPSMRSAQQAPSQPHVPEAIRDLLWDDTPPPSTTTPQAPPPTLQPQATGTLSPQHTAAPTAQRNVFGATDPFANSPFGSSQSHTPDPNKNLLDDDDEPAAPSPPLQDKSAEIGNVQNQLNSTNRSLETTKTERQNVERALAEQASQLAMLQTQLSSAKAAYETETRLLSNLRERFNTQTADIQKAREELIHAESDLSAVRVEKTEIEQNLLRDKEEVRALQRKMAEVGSQVEILKAEVEKAKKEARQQKGLLAVARKQLATRETERAKVEKELADAQAEVQAATKEREEAEAELAKDVPSTQTNGHDIVPSGSPDSVAIAAAHPLPVSPELNTPVSPSSIKSTNPFERLAMAGNPSRTGSPFMPFSDTSVPTPTAPSNEPAPAPAAADDQDPFGFSAASESDVAQHTETQESKPAELGELAPPGSNDSAQNALSPASTDLFMTPPSTATLTKPAEFASEGDSASQFPPIDAVVSTDSGTDTTAAKPPTDDSHTEHTHLDTQLKELDADESDSSDSDDDEPLTNVKAKLAEKPSAPSTQEPPEPAAAPAPTSAFDDSFGMSSTPVQSASPAPPAVTETQPTPGNAAPATKDDFDSVFGVPAGADATQAPQADLSTPKPNGTTAASVSDFDEAFGKISSSSGPSQFSQFSFDSAFDDNFDFAAASASAPTDATPSTAIPSAPNGFPAPGTALQATTAPAATEPAGKDEFDAVFLPSEPGTSAQLAAAPVQSTSTGTAPGTDSRPFSFDDAFSSGSAQAPPPVAQPSQSNGSVGISFDDAFGGHPSEALALDNSFTSTQSTQSTPQKYAPPPGPPPSHSGVTPFPTSTPPISPGRGSSSDARRSMSPPPRQMSPPPRHSSPKLRPSTASSDKEKEKPPTRHSKLSIRLPFGRKKAKHHEAPPVPALAQQQVVEEPTPPADDDIEAVKTLCGMGFSRTQAVSALEKHGYDVQRALNSLLGGSRLAQPRR